jgi:hypothetical protein
LKYPFQTSSPTRDHRGYLRSVLSIEILGKVGD